MFSLISTLSQYLIDTKDKSDTCQKKKSPKTKARTIDCQVINGLDGDLWPYRCYLFYPKEQLEITNFIMEWQIAPTINLSIWYATITVEDWLLIVEILTASVRPNPNSILRIGLLICCPWKILEYQSFFLSLNHWKFHYESKYLK